MNALLKIARSKNVKKRLAEVSATAQGVYEKSRGSDAMVNAGHSGFSHRYERRGTPVSIAGSQTAGKTRLERFKINSKNYGEASARKDSKDISDLNNSIDRRNRGHDSGKGAGIWQHFRDEARASDNRSNKAKESSMAGQAANDKQPSKFGLSRNHKIAIGVGAVGAAGVTAAGLYGAKKLRDHIKAKRQKDEAEKSE